ENGAEPVLVRLPSSASPGLIFNLSTSHACYVFKTDEKCPKQQNLCKDKTFSCSSKNYHFSFPSFANHSITKPISGTTEYTFGFCAKDVDCSIKDKPAENGGVMICKKLMKDGQVYHAISVAWYKDLDNTEVIVRPTGFVWKIKKKPYGDDLKAVVIFQCGEHSSEYIDLVVREDEKV
ncbi:hypothetical protein QZH41_013287, partial [Actinostola sp. cb2023]